MDPSPASDLLDVERPAPLTEAAAPASEAPRCPFPHAAAPVSEPAQCPFPHTARAPIQRSRADMVVRRVLRIRERPPGMTSASAYSAFQRSMLISAIRCTMTYVVFP